MTEPVPAGSMAVITEKITGMEKLFVAEMRAVREALHAGDLGSRAAVALVAEQVSGVARQHNDLAMQSGSHNAYADHAASQVRVGVERQINELREGTIKRLDAHSDDIQHLAKAMSGQHVINRVAGVVGGTVLGSVITLVFKVFAGG